MDPISFLANRHNYQSLSVCSTFPDLFHESRLFTCCHCHHYQKKMATVHIVHQSYIFSENLFHEIIISPMAFISNEGQVSTSVVLLSAIGGRSITEVGQIVMYTCRKLIYFLASFNHLNHDFSTEWFKELPCDVLFSPSRILFFCVRVTAIQQRTNFWCFVSFTLALTDLQFCSFCRLLLFSGLTAN